MGTAIRILVVEGNTAATNAAIAELGGRPYGEAYAAALKSLDPRIECAIVHPCEDGEYCVAAGVNGSELDGVVWTGSSLNVYAASPPVDAQIALARRMAEWRVPIFGSCWGFQVMTVTLGGSVVRNPRGREMGIARDIDVTDAGAAHPIYAGKPRHFDAIAAHIDEVKVLPNEAVLLAGNKTSAIQAAAWADDGRSFWGVQYHPEFDFAILANALRRNSHHLLDEGVFANAEELEAYTDSLERVHRDPVGNRFARDIYGLSHSTVDATVRSAELRNWIVHEVLGRRKPQFRPAAARAGG